MVLGLTLRKSSKRRDSKDEGGSPIRPSPSLPHLSSKGMEWPSDLVVTEMSPSEFGDITPTSATFAPSFGRIPPPRQNSGKNFRSFRKSSQYSVIGGPDAKENTGSIASIYASPHPPTAFARVDPVVLYSNARSKRRAPHAVPTFNIMIVGGAGTGKSSLLRLLLDTCQISPQATPTQRESVEKLMHGPLRATETMQSATVEIEEGRERISLTLIDTPGLRGTELDLERFVTSIVGHLDMKFAETLSEESKVVRQSKGDQHVHLCIYLIAPESVKPIRVSPPLSPSLPPAQPLVPSARPDSGDASPRFRDGADSELSRFIDGPIPEDVPLPLSVTGHGSSDDHEEVEAANAPSANNRKPNSHTLSNDSQATTPAKLLLNAVEEATQEPEQEMKMSLIPSEIQVIKRLSERVNVLPIISRADTMTNERLEEVKNAIRQDLKKAGLGFSLLGNIEEDEVDEEGGEDEEDEEADEEPAPRTTNGDQKMDRHVVRIRPTRPSSGRRSSHSLRSRSRARAALTHEDLANSDDSGGPLTLTDLRKVIPFAIMSPDPVPSSSGSQMRSLASSASSSPSPARGGDTIVSHSEFLTELRGKYTRNYRWGSVDVLDPQHCDYLALRHAVLGPQMHMLRQTTKEVLYEKYRTEKLLARRATQILPAPTQSKVSKA